MEADDFARKPIVESELVARILHRLDQVKLRRKLMVTDPLTSVAVIMLTGDRQSADSQNCRNLGIQGLIAKPFEPMTLAEQISDRLAWER